MPRIALGAIEAPQATVGSLVTVDTTGRLTTSDTLTVPLRIPSGTTAQRPLPWRGGLRYNTDTQRLEYANGLDWNTLDAAAGGQALMVHRTTPVVLSGSQTVDVVYDVVDYQTAGISYNSSTGEVTVNDAGVYFLLSHVVAENDTLAGLGDPQDRLFFTNGIVVNGAETYQSRATLSSASNIERMHVDIHTLAQLGAGDVLKVRLGWQLRGQSITVRARARPGGANDRTFAFIIWKVR